MRPWFLLTLGLIYFFSGGASAQSAGAVGQKILIYPTAESATPVGSVAFLKNANDPINCRLTLQKHTPAEILEENDKMFKILLKSEINGCYGRDSWFSNVAPEGWVNKNEIYFTPDPSNSDAEVKVASQDQPATSPRKKEDPNCDHTGNRQVSRAQDQAAAIENAIRQQGMKSSASVDFYFGCYPPRSPGSEFYPKIKPVIELLPSIFAIEFRGQTLSPDPTLMKCLIRQESQFNPLAGGKDVAGNPVGGVGLGQQITQNRQHHQFRLSQPNSWERKLWDQFFSRMKATPEGRKMLIGCEPPKMSSAQDSQCPLNSLAAAALDVIRIQQALITSSGKAASASGLDFNLAVGMSYNLGIGDGSRAVVGKPVNSWPGAVLGKYSSPGRKQEGSQHMLALKNCMAENSMRPMSSREKVNGSCQPRSVPLPPRRPVGL